MLLKETVSGYLERFEGGRAFKSRVKVAMRENAPEGRTIHPQLAHLSYVYVEASFLCNLECRMCPRLYEGHREGLMPLERFMRLSPLFPYLDSVVLTGYGEPMVHPRLHEFAAAVTAFGGTPRLSTNGTLLNEEKGNQLIDAGVDNLQVSIDAGTKETYEIIRVGAKWERVLKNCANFHRLVKRRNANVGTGWVFVLMRDNFRELPRAIRVAADHGFEMVVAKHIERNALDYEHQQLMYDDNGNLLVDEKEYEDVLAEARSIAAALNVNLRLHPFHTGFKGACLADPLQSFFVDWMGNLSPCCHLPVRAEGSDFPEHSFGNLDDQDVMQILLGPRVQNFINEWRNRVIPKVCAKCYQIKRLPNASQYMTAA